MQDTLTPSSAKTIRNIQRDFPEWHLGRPHYLLWALDVDLEPVRERVAAAQNHLSTRLLAGYVRQPHITLSLCGFPSAAPRRLDDFGADILHQQIDALHRLRPQAFTIAIGALDGFSSAPYLSVADSGGHIERLRTALDLCPHPLARTDYRPHVTIGLYADAWPLAEIEAELLKPTPFASYDDPETGKGAAARGGVAVGEADLDGLKQDLQEEFQEDVDGDATVIAEVDALAGRKPDAEARGLISGLKTAKMLATVAR